MMFPTLFPCFVKSVTPQVENELLLKNGASKKNNMKSKICDTESNMPGALQTL